MTRRKWATTIAEDLASGDTTSIIGSCITHDLSRDYLADFLELYMRDYWGEVSNDVKILMLLWFAEVS